MNGGVSCNCGLFFTLHSSLFPYFLHFSINTLSFTFRQVRTLVLAPVSIILIKWLCNLALMQPWHQRAQSEKKCNFVIYTLEMFVYTKCRIVRKYCSPLPSYCRGSYAPMCSPNPPYPRKIGKNHQTVFVSYKSTIHP